MLLYVTVCLMFFSCKPSEQRSKIHLEDQPTLAARMPSAQMPRKNEEITILETVIRYQIANGDPSNATRLGYAAYFLGYIDEDTFDLFDPDELLVKRLDDVQPPVKPFNQCTKTYKGVFDNKTNDRGYLLTLGRVKWDSDGEVQVGAGYYSFRLCAAEQIFHLQKTNGRWIVVKEDRLSTS